MSLNITNIKASHQITREGKREKKNKILNFKNKLANN